MPYASPRLPAPCAPVRAARLALVLLFALGIVACGGDPSARGDAGALESGAAFDAGLDASAEAGEAGPAPCAFSEVRCGATCVDTQRSERHCGACDQPCRGAANADATCRAGQCRLRCRDGFADCDGDASNGCERSLGDDPAHCGACGARCAARPNSTSSCRGGVCELACAGTFADCDGAEETGCETDTSFDARHCGACGNSCSWPPRSDFLCNAGRCAFLCRTGFADCDGEASNGCEASLLSGRHCGSCGNECPAAAPLCALVENAYRCFSECPADTLACDRGCVDVRRDLDHCGACGVRCAGGLNAQATCVAGRCGLECRPGYADCDGEASNGCEVELAQSPLHCGACGNACPAGPASEPACVRGVCRVRCAPGALDCDGLASTGCEVTSASDLRNCGACGNRCPEAPNAVAACLAGRCELACEPGFASCDRDEANGCEVALRTNPEHCGACGVRCAEGEQCADGRCVPTPCPAGRGECDGDPATRCETDLNSAAAHCGGCGLSCARSNAQVACRGGVCALERCTPGFGSCDGDPSNGCETALTSAQHCGGCGVRCGFANGAAVCADGRCALAGCAPGFGNCDGNATNGCEVALDTSSAHCGACGSACAAGRRCVDGVCAPSAMDAGAPDARPDAGVDASAMDARVDATTDARPDAMTDAGASLDAAADAASPADAADAPQDAASPTDAATDAAPDAPPCASPLVSCAGSCVDVRTSASHCGACGNACPSGQSCVAGACVCPLGEALCAGRCVNPSSSAEHCGMCGNACPMGQVCSSGACRCAGANELLCAGACVDRTTSTAHCGACGNACPAGQVCSAGVCGVSCVAPTTACGAGAGMYCANLRTDNANCGACGVVCAGGRVCAVAMGASVGSCQCPTASPTACAVAGGGTACTSLQTDANNCGACGARCAAGTVCSAGRCVCTSAATPTLCPPCAPGTSCAVGSACVATSSDGAHCGACGNACNTAAGFACSAGACACAAGATDCGGACANLQTDNANCGACGLRCASGARCTAGACVGPAAFAGSFGASWEERAVERPRADFGLPSFVPRGVREVLAQGGSGGESQAAVYDLDTNAWSATTAPGVRDLTNYQRTTAIVGRLVWLAADNQLYRYDLDAARWTTHQASRLSGVDNLGAETDGAGNVYLLTSVGQLVRYDTSRDALDARGVSPPTGGLRGARLAYDPTSGRFLVWANNGNRTLSTLRFGERDLTAVTSMPFVPMSLAFCGDRSGGVVAGELGTKFMWRYTRADNRWTRLPDLPTAANEAQCFFVDEGSSRGWLYVLSYTPAARMYRITVR